MIKAYAYSRFSHPSQRIGRGLERQLKGCRAWAAKHDLELDISHHDPGLSGFTGMNRVKGALGTFLAKVENGEIEKGSYLLVDSLDRLSRENETRVLNMLTGLTLAGIKVVNVVEDHVLDENADMVDFMRVLIHATRSRHESAEKGRKVGEAHEDRKERARKERIAWHRTGPHWLEGTAHGKGKERYVTYAQKPDKVRIVRKVFDLLESGLGTSAVAIRLNDDKEPTPKDGEGGWHHSTVLEIAKNRAVLGEYQPKFARQGNRASRRPKDGEAVPGYYGKGIISTEQFYKVQDIIKGRAPKSGRRPNAREYTNLFFGLGRCYRCGGHVGIHTASKRNGWKRTAVLTCVNSRRGKCDLDQDGTKRDPWRPNKVRYPYEPLEVAILDNLVEWEPPRPTKTVSRTSKAIETAQASRADIEARLTNVMQLAEQTGDVDFVRRKNELQAELREADAALSTLRGEMRQAGTAMPYESRQQALQRLSEQMVSAHGEELYRLRVALAVSLRCLIDWIDFDPDGSVRVILSGATVAYQFNAEMTRFRRIDIPQAIAAE
jgi:DNA invertase Pin-like site-specific DNA recombinase